MPDGILFVLFIIVAVFAGAVAGYILKQIFTAKKIRASESLAARIVEESKKEADTIKKEAILQAKENLLKMKADFDAETKEIKSELEGLERRIRSKEENMDKRMDVLSQKESNIENRDKALGQKEQAVEEKHRKLDALIEEQKIKLEKIAGMTPEEAKNILISSMEAEARRDAAVLVRKAEEEAKLTADRKAREIIAYSIQRYAGDYVAERTVSVVNLPSEEMKGRIIGREGRNIRAIEAATGIDLIVDDTPEAVVLSSFDPIRREVARISLERLIQDGRIHPGRIEDIVKKVEKEVEQIIRETGEKASFDCGVHDIHPEIINMLGALRKELIGSVGKEHTRRLLTRMGYAAGVRDAELAKRTRGQQSAVDAFLTGPQLHMLEGAARVTPLRMDIDIDAGRFDGEFRWDDSWEAYAHRQKYGVVDAPALDHRRRFGTQLVAETKEREPPVRRQGDPQIEPGGAACSHAHHQRLFAHLCVRGGVCKAGNQQDIGDQQPETHGGHRRYQEEMAPLNIVGPQYHQPPGDGCGHFTEPS